MSETEGENRRYHIEMTLNTLRKMRPSMGDTRSYLDLDEAERLILIQLLEQEFKKGGADDKR
jgi:hypothetical protein